MPAISSKTRQQSTWKLNIEKKIEGLETLIKLLERVVKLKKLDKLDKSKVLTFMSQQKLKIGSSIIAREVISRCNKRILIYKKKIDMHQKRKEFSQQNTMFELYRRRFYNSLEGESVVTHQVDSKEIKSFWE